MVGLLSSSNHNQTASKGSQIVANEEIRKIRAHNLINPVELTRHDDASFYKNYSSDSEIKNLNSEFDQSETNNLLHPLSKVNIGLFYLLNT